MNSKARTNVVATPELSGSFNIGEAADATGVSAKMIRHYESIGLIPKAKRTASNYRFYSESDLHSLRFIRQARNLGFSIEAIGNLLRLWRNRGRPSRDVKKLVTHHITELNERIHDLKVMKNTLEDLAHRCHGDDRPDCPILETLENERHDHAHPTRPKLSPRRNVNVSETSKRNSRE